MCNVQSLIYFMCICISILITTSRADKNVPHNTTEKNEEPLRLGSIPLRVETQKEEVKEFVSKSKLRNELRIKLASMSVEERARQSKLIQSKLLDHPLYLFSKRVSVYISTELEVSTHEIIKNIFDSKKTCFVPKYDKHSVMSMVKVKSIKDLNSLPKTNIGIIQPGDDDDKREDAMLTGGLDLLIVPGLGFTDYGKRLGRGRGCYDRYIEKYERIFPNSTCMTMGLAFNEQIVDDIPYSLHDHFINYVVTPRDYVIPESEEALGQKTATV